MAEGGVGTSPQVFVVDSQATYVSMPSEKKPRWAKVNQKFLLLLVGLAMLGLVVEGYFIHNLYKKTEAFSFCGSDPLCQNLSKLKNQQGGVIMGQVGIKESNEIPIVQPHQLPQIKQRPFAHLIGSNTPGKTEVVQWDSESGDAITRNMSYNKGRLIVENEGHYYLYSKIQANAAEDCTFIQHKVMKETNAYGKSIELMKSKSFRCNHTQKPSGSKSSGADEMWNSFLAGIFYLDIGDKIFVSLENTHVQPGTAYNFMGAFMISP